MTFLFDAAPEQRVACAAAALALGDLDGLAAGDLDGDGRADLLLPRLVLP